jgi:hypothetical protein
MVERGIEARDLRQRRMELRQRRDGGQVMWLVEWRKRNEAGELSDDCGVDPHWRLVGRAAMDDPMSSCDQAELREATIEPAEKRGKRFLMAGAFGQMLVGERRARTVIRREVNPVTDAFAGAFAEKGDTRRLDVAGEEREFDARRAGVENEDGVAHRVAPAV